MVLPHVHALPFSRYGCIASLEQDIMNGTKVDSKVLREHLGPTGAGSLQDKTRYGRKNAVSTQACANVRMSVLA